MLTDVEAFSDKPSAELDEIAAVEFKQMSNEYTTKHDGKPLDLQSHQPVRPGRSLAPASNEIESDFRAVSDNLYKGALFLPFYASPSLAPRG